MLYCDHACRLEGTWGLRRRLGLEKLAVTNVWGMGTLVDAKEANFSLNCFVYSKTSALALNRFRPDTTA